MTIKSKKERISELNARLAVEVVDLDTELQHFLRLIRKMRVSLQEQLAESEYGTDGGKPANAAKQLAVVRGLGEITKMLDRAVSMEIKLDKNKKLRQAKLRPDEYLDGAARFILSQGTSTRAVWLRDVCKRHLEIAELENPGNVAKHAEGTLAQMAMTEPPDQGTIERMKNGE